MIRNDLSIRITFHTTNSDADVLTKASTTRKIVLKTQKKKDPGTTIDYWSAPVPGNNQKLSQNNVFLNFYSLTDEITNQHFLNKQLYIIAEQFGFSDINYELEV